MGRVPTVFDDLDRLTTVTFPNGDSTSYVYDVTGNRLTETVNGLQTLISDGSTGYR